MIGGFQTGLTVATCSFCVGEISVVVFVDRSLSVSELGVSIPASHPDEGWWWWWRRRWSKTGHQCFAEFFFFVVVGGGVGGVLKSLLNIQIKQFQAWGGDGQRVLTHVLEKKWGALKSNLKKIINWY